MSQLLKTHNRAVTHEQWLIQHDVEYFLSETLPFQVKMAWAREGMTQLKEEEILKIAKRVCNLWTRKKKPIAKRSDLTEKAWGKVQEAARSLTDQMCGRTEGEALQMIRTRVPCSAGIIRNLVCNLRVWKEPTVADIQR